MRKELIKTKVKFEIFGLFSINMLSDIIGDVDISTISGIEEALSILSCKEVSSIYHPKKST